MRKVIAMLLALMMVMSVLTGCQSAEKQAESTEAEKQAVETETNNTEEVVENADETTEEVAPVKIAGIQNLTGGSAVHGEFYKKGMDLVINAINEQGGVKSLGGAKIELVLGDTMSDTTQVKAVAERIFADDEILCCIHFGGSANTLAGMPTAEKYGVPCFAGYSIECTSQGYKYILQAFANSTMAAPQQMAFLDYVGDYLDLETNKVGILYVDNDYGISTAEGNKKVISTASDFEIVYDSSFPANLTDASSIITSLKASGAEALFLTAEPAGCKAIFAAMDALNYHPFVVGGGSAMLLNTFAEDLGDEVLGICSTASISHNTTNITSNPELQAWIDLFVETYGEWPTESSLEGMSYLLMVVDSLERTGSRDREVLLEDMKSNEHFSYFFPSKDGIVKFNENGLNENAELLIVQWQKDPKYDFVAPLTVYPTNITDQEIYYDGFQ